MSELLNRILDAPLERLEKLVQTARSEPDDSEALSLYASGLAAYLGGNLQLLSALTRECTNRLDDTHPARVILELRFKLRSRTLRREDVQSLRQVQVPSNKGSAWEGEFEFVRALGLECLGAFEDSMRAYERASVLLAKAGANGKALKAEYNRLCLLSQLYPDHPYAHEFETFAARARELGATGVLAMTQVNLSREYQKAGALALAFERADEACRILKEQGLRHSKDDYLARLQRAHVLDGIGQRDKAISELNGCRVSPFPEIQACISALEYILGLSQESPALDSIPATWGERVRERSGLLNHCDGFAGLELKIIEVLSQKECDKFELIERVYGSQISPLVGENRLKNLLHRIRKRAPNLVSFSNGIYRMNPALGGSRS